jgi:hypothetical protein
MGSALIQLIPEVVGSVAMPSWILLVLALLSGGRGVGRATALVTGVTCVRLGQGLVFGTVLSAAELSHQFTGSEAIVSALLIALGVLLWAMAVWNAVRTNDIKLLSVVDGITPMRALGVGALLVVTSPRAWIFTLAAIGVIERAHLDIPQSLIAYFVYVLGAQALLFTPILISTRSTVRIEAAARWLQHYNRPIVVIVSVAVGGYFLWKGITGFTG